MRERESVREQRGLPFCVSVGGQLRSEVPKGTKVRKRYFRYLRHSGRHLTFGLPVKMS